MDYKHDQPCARYFGDSWRLCFSGRDLLRNLYFEFSRSAGFDNLNFKAVLDDLIYRFGEVVATLRGSPTENIVGCQISLEFLARGHFASS